MLGLLIWILLPLALAAAVLLAGSVCCVVGAMQQQRGDRDRASSGSPQATRLMRPRAPYSLQLN